MREAERWFSEAGYDLETAKILHSSRRFNAACFYAHQAAEKSVKALLYSVNESSWGHSVRVLIERYVEKTGDEKFMEFISLARTLDAHYIPSRYPNAHPAGPAHEAYDENISAQAIAAAEKIVREVEGRLGGK
jgi:HEPN domain-containing protein